MTVRMIDKELSQLSIQEQMEVITKAMARIKVLYEQETKDMLTDDQWTEIQKRSQQVHSGEVEGLSWNDIKEEVLSARK